MVSAFRTSLIKLSFPYRPSRHCTSVQSCNQYWVIKNFIFNHIRWELIMNQGRNRVSLFITKQIKNAWLFCFKIWLQGGIHLVLLPRSPVTYTFPSWLRERPLADDGSYVFLRSLIGPSLIYHGGTDQVPLDARAASLHFLENGLTRTCTLMPLPARWRGSKPLDDVLIWHREALKCMKINSNNLLEEKRKLRQFPATVIWTISRTFSEV